MTAPDHFAKAELNIFRRRGPSTHEIRRRNGIADATVLHGWGVQTRRRQLRLGLCDPDIVPASEF
jgi:hypothetical protein